MGRMRNWIESPMVLDEALFQGLFTPDGGIDGSSDPSSL